MAGVPEPQHTVF